MGTKLECAVNPLASSLNSNSCSFTVHFVDDYFRTRGLKENCSKIGIGIGIGLDRQLQSSMDRALERHNMESIRKTMQVHEDIFKHQVRELHRLYSVQKMLMDELKNEIKQKRFWTKTPMMASSDINQSQFINQQYLTTQTSGGYNFQYVQGDPSSRERSGSCSAETMRMARGFDLERPAGGLEDISAEASAVEQDQAAGPSSLIRQSRINQMSIEGPDEDSEVELTLSIGGGGSSSSSKKNMAKINPKRNHSQELGCNTSVSIQRELDSSASFKSDRGGEDCSGPNTPMSRSSATVDQERKRPHWLFQGLSINRT